MQLSAIGLLLALAIFVTQPAAHAQPSATVPRIGVLVTPSPSSMSPNLEAFRRGLHEHGWLEDQNLAIEC